MLVALLALRAASPLFASAARSRHLGPRDVYAGSIAEADPRLEDWLAETYAPADASSRGADSQRRGLEVLSWDPKVFVFRNFLSSEEADAMLEAAAPRLVQSAVVDAKTGRTKADNIRTSKSALLQNGESPAIRAVEERVSRVTMTNPCQGEGIQVIKYEVGEQYGAHHDYFTHAAADDHGGNRLVTAVMYLSDVEEGGETVFPKVKPPPSQTSESYSECAMQGLANKPRKGDMIVFWSIRSNGELDYQSMHASCPVIKGEKWSATKWVHVAKLSEGHVERVLYTPPSPPDVPGCIDMHESCPLWASAGSCEQVPAFLIATKARPGLCLKSCNRCDMGPNDPNFKGTYIFSMSEGAEE